MAMGETIWICASVMTSPMGRQHVLPSLHPASHQFDGIEARVLWKFISNNRVSFQAPLVINDSLDDQVMVEDDPDRGLRDIEFIIGRQTFSYTNIFATS